MTRGAWIVVAGGVRRQRGASRAIATMVGGATAAGTIGLTIAESPQTVPDEGTSALLVPVLLAFGAFMLASALFFVVNVVGSAVIGRAREIGLLLAVGFTPRQITLVLVGQVLAPALVGAVIGSVAGWLSSGPLLEDAGAVLRPGEAFGPSPASGLVAVVAVLAMTTAAAVLPTQAAARAGATAILARGRVADGAGDDAPPRGARLLTTLPATLVVRLGLRRLLARPLRAAMTGGAITFGVAAVVLTLVVQIAFDRGAEALLRSQAAPLRTPAVRAGEAERLGRVLAGAPGVERFVRVDRLALSVPDLGEVAAFAYTGEASWIGYEMVDGRWYGATDEVVVSTRLFDLLDLAVGDRLTLASGTLSVDVTVAGTVFDIEPDIANHLLVRGDATAFSALGATPVSTEFEARPVEGHSSTAVVASLSEAGVPAFVAEPIGNHETVLIVRTTIVALGAVLLAVAIAGVANTVLLDVAERARESAILGALGMTPAQRRRVAVTAVVPLGVVGGMAGVPIGGTLANWVLVEMGRAGGGTRVPEVILDPLGPAVACLALVGVVVAGIGAWVPAGLAARRAIAPDLRAE